MDIGVFKHELSDTDSMSRFLKPNYIHEAKLTFFLPDSAAGRG